MKYAKQIGKLVENAPNTEDIIAVHGTSLDSILYLAENGKFKTNGLTPGEFYFYCVKDFYPESSPKKSYEFKEAFEKAEHFAQWTTKRHEIHNKIIETGNKIQDKAIKDYNQELSEYVNYSVGISEGDCSILDSIIGNDYNLKWDLDKIRMRINKKIDTKERGGFVVYLSKKLFDEFDVIQNIDDWNNDEYFVKSPNGISIDYISGIEPMGKVEWDKMIGFQR